MSCTLILVARSVSLRCAVCHDDVDSDAEVCRACSARFHADCRRDLARCPTLGCAPGRPATSGVVVRPRRAPTRSGLTVRWIAKGTSLGVVFGVGLGVLAALIEANAPRYGLWSAGPSVSSLLTTFGLWTLGVGAVGAFISATSLVVERALEWMAERVATREVVAILLTVLGAVLFLVIASAESPPAYGWSVAIF